MFTGHRFRPAYEFDYVALDILSPYAEDSGVYTCKATNAAGETVTSASVRCISEFSTIVCISSHCHHLFIFFTDDHQQNSANF
jgi:hypothetical protein